MAVKVTVVVPTYNSGSHIEALVDSMLRQTLPADEFEVLFVDDGSTDDTPARLEALVGEHDHFRMTRIPNSGWPGRPRNIGVDQANGEYVQFADHDDRMAPEALERLYAMGQRNGSDIVIGKVASNFRSRGVPYGLMSRTRESCTVRNAPLIDSLTPHKMFRTAFLREHGIVHPEGPWILEDQLFMVRSYLKASVVSVVGDYVTYSYWAREDEENAGTALMDPRWYYGNLRQIMATVVEGTEPGADRDRLLRRFYRVEMLSRLGVPARGALMDPRFDSDPFEAVRELAEEFVTDAMHDGLAPLLRVRSTLLRQNRPEELAEFTLRQTDLKARCTAESATWNRDRLKVAFTTRFEERPDGSGLVLSRDGDRHFLAPYLTDGIVDEPVDVTRELKTFKVDVLLRHTETAHVWVLPHRTSLVLEEERGADGTMLVRPLVTGTVTIDPRHAAGGGPLGEGRWQVQVRLSGAGLDRYAELGEATPAAGLPVPAPQILAGHRITPAHTDTGLTLVVRATDDTPAPRPPKVSVVVPTHEAAPESLRETLDSLTAQTLPAHDIDVVLVGDGDGEVLPASDAASRNAGIDAATGQYVLFMEPGDRLAPDALRRMYDYGMEHDSDIVVGKLAGKDRALPRELFVRDRPRATLAKDPLADSLTANKLFDRAFLTEHALRFPEDRHPLSEQLFTAQAYLRAGHASVLGSQVCYHYGPKRPAAPVPAAEFYAALPALLGTADTLAGPGAARDRLHRRWLRVEVLDRIGGKQFLELDEEARTELLHEIREALSGRVSETAVAGLPVSRRVAVGLIEDGDQDSLVRLIEWENSIACRPTLTELSWQDDGTMHIAFGAQLHAADGPVGVTTDDGDDGDRHVLTPTGLPRPLLDRFAAEPLTGGASPDKASVVLVLRERSSGAEYRMVTESTVVRGNGGLRVTGSTGLDPARAVAGSPLGQGVWDLSVRLNALGWTKSTRLGKVRAPEVPAQLTAVAHPTERTLRITPYWTNPHRDLSLRVEVPEPPKPAAAAPRPRGSRLLGRVARIVRKR